MQFLKTAGVFAAFTVFSISPLSAQAVDNNNNSTQEQFYSYSWTELPGVKPGTSIPLVRTVPYASQIAIGDSSGIRVIEVSKPGETLGSVLRQNGILIQNHRDENGKRLNPDFLLTDGATNFIFKVEYSSQFAKVTLPAPVEEQKAEDLPKGEVIVIEAGSEGVALKTIVSARDSSKEKSVNSKARSNQAAATVENMTIIEPPKPRKIIVGTGDSFEQRNFEYSKGLIMPVLGTVTSKFGMRVHPITGVLKLHDGMDFASSCGNEVKASATGRVVDLGIKGGYGNKIELEHGANFNTSYSHLSKILVEKNQIVRQGDVIGLVGSTGYSTGCHLHFMTTLDGKPIDPSTILGNS